jgi:RNA polymerase sigma factor (sigma-70 family)
MLRLASDERLVEQVRAGSERAFEAIVDRHGRPLLAFCRRMLGSQADAEDVLQHTFLSAYRDLKRSDRSIALRPWLYTIARHRCVSVLRSRREHPVDELPQPACDDLDAVVGSREEVRATLAGMAELPDDQRNALILSELGDMSHEDIALVLGCRREKVKALVFQARTALAGDRAARDSSCAAIRDRLGRGGPRPAVVRRHLRDCASCQAFHAQLRVGRGALGLLLPVIWLKRWALAALPGFGGGAAVTAGAVGGGGLAITAVATAVAVAGGGGGGGADPPAATARADAVTRTRIAAAPVRRPAASAARRAIVLQRTRPVRANAVGGRDVRVVVGDSGTPGIAGDRPERAVEPEPVPRVSPGERVDPALQVRDDAPAQQQPQAAEPPAHAGGPEPAGRVPAGTRGKPSERPVPPAAGGDRGQADPPGPPATLPPPATGSLPEPPAEPPAALPETAKGPPDVPAGGERAPQAKPALGAVAAG